MHSLEILTRLNSASESAKLARANRQFNNPRLHAKASEKTGVPVSPAAWTTDEQWERKMKREGKR